MAAGARTWRTAREQDIVRAYRDKSCWTQLDYCTDRHPYSFKSIEQWPLDAALIYEPTDRASVLLGSIKAACCLTDIFKTLSVKVTVVVTMCGDEMKIRGAPNDWPQYFGRQGVFHVSRHLEDTTLKPAEQSEGRILELVDSCLGQWKVVCGLLWQRSKSAVMDGGSMHVLFHCFGGINRSAGVLCAWLVVAYDFSADDAVGLLLKKRPSLRPWRNRPYVLEALFKLEGLRMEWQLQFGSMG